MRGQRGEAQAGHPVLMTLLLLVLAGCASHSGAFRPDAEIDPIEQLALHQRLSGAPSPEQCEDLHLASFNVKLPEDRSRLERLRVDILGDELLRMADVWLLQEIETIDGQNAVEYLADEFGSLNYVYAPSRITDDGDTHGLAILSRFPLRKVERLWLPRFNLVANSRDRIALTATVDLCGRPVKVYNVHLDTRLNFGARRTQLSSILDAAAPHQRVVVAGDFNTNSFLWLGHLLPIPWSSQAKKLDRLMTEAGHSAPFAKLGGTAKMGARLDAIYVKGLSADEPAIGPWMAESDHRPLHVLLGEADPSPP